MRRCYPSGGGWPWRAPRRAALVAGSARSPQSQRDRRRGCKSAGRPS